MYISILLQTENFLVLNKPAGLMVHPDGKSQETTLVDWIVQNFPQTAKVGESLRIQNGSQETFIARPGIVHRLDKDTTGAIIIALNQKTHQFFKKQFQNHEIQKIYHAFTYGSPVHVDGIIDQPIGRSGRDFRQWTTGKSIRGIARPAMTAYQLIQKKEIAGEKYSFIEFRPKTGRTHQIRVHAKMLHCPVVADALYANKLSKTSQNLGFVRQALHAFQISFIDLSGQTVTVQADYPHDFLHALDIFKTL